MTIGNALSLRKQVTNCLGGGERAARVKFIDVVEGGCLRFDKDQRLGSGSCGTRVYLGTYRQQVTNEHLLVAIKEGHYDIQRYREVENLQQLIHPNVVRYIYADKEEKFNLLFIALELCRGSLVNLFDHKLDVFNKPFILNNHVPCDDWWFKKTILLGIANGLDYVHGQRFIHRDLKPQNILVQDDDNNIYGFKAVLCDFELTRKLKKGQSKLSVSQVTVGTQGWMAKEVLNGATKPTSAVDVFAYGCIVHYVLSENRSKQFKHPFGSDVLRDSSILTGKRFSYISLNLTTFNDDSSDYDDDDSEASGYGNLAQDFEYLGDAILADMLVDACVSGKKVMRPQASALLTHPFFWNYGDRMLCCQQFFNNFKHDFQRSPLIKSMEQTWKELTRPEFQFFSQIPEAFEYYKLHRMSIKRNIPPDNVISTIYNSMMRFIRNLQQHYHEAVKMYPSLIVFIPSGDNETLGEYFFETIPMSFPVIYLFHKLHEDTSYMKNDKNGQELHILTKKTLRTLFEKHVAL
ncbi:serine/threonine-protein kinase/endoribonuclease IRE2-like [Bolinopsis microptera]|uniref:serine/threonine-protein kinase/endoribonuclease IRE2-like n=1 Tax=Bolinopsis microptera TaxID=2820187 RepID=UPI003079853B